MQPMRPLSVGPDPDALRRQIKSKEPRLFERLDQIAVANPLPPLRGNLSPVPDKMIYYVNHIKHLTIELVEAIGAAASDRRSVSGFEYHVHPLSEDGFLYLIEFWFERAI